MLKISSLTEKLTRKPSKGKFIPFIDGLRFLAIMPVIFQHANERLLKYGDLPTLNGFEQFVSFLISRGTIGVFLFFAISGFVLSLPIAKTGERENYGLYLKRRLHRIEPPFLFWMACCALLLLVMGTYPFQELFWHFLATITYTHQIFFSSYSIINPVAWSLEVEIQFYLIAPFLAKAYFSFNQKQNRRLALVAIIFSWLVLQHSLGWHLAPWKASILGQLPHFLIGMLAADLYTQPVRFFQKFKFWDILFPIFFIAMAFTWTEELAKSILFEIALLGVFLSAFYGKVLHKFLSISWVAIIGGMCYTLYLIHLPLMEGFYSFIGKFGQWSGYFGQLSISLIFLLPVVLLCGIIAYQRIEQPFMKRKKSGIKPILNSGELLPRRQKPINA